MPLSNTDCSISPVFQAFARLICSGFNVVCGENVCGCGDLETLNGGFRSDFGENAVRRWRNCDAETAKYGAEMVVEICDFG